jgi:hypothetical protein
MENEFVTYEQALALNELGFGEMCFGGYNKEDGVLLVGYDTDAYEHFNRDFYIPAPLKQQVFRWFRDKYRLNSIVYNDDGDVEYGNISFGYEIRIILFSFDDMSNMENARIGKFFFKTYEEAENQSMNHLIELAKQQNNGK